MKSKKSVIKDVIKPTSISPKSSFTDPNDPWSAKANVAENITSKRSDLLKQFYKSKGWNVNYISKNKRVSQSKTGDYEKWKRDHGIYEEDQIDEVSSELLGRYKTAAGSQASELDKAGGKENIQKANKRFSGIVKATKKQFANDDKKQGVMEMDKSQTPPGRDGGPVSGPDKYVKPISAKKFKNHALSILQKSLQLADKKKNVKEAKDAGEYDYEGAMAKTQLQTICRNAEDLKNMLLDDENLPEWVQAKITKAEDYITTSLDYMKSKAELDEDSVDPQAATQSPADGANGGETLAPPKKSIKRIVKEFHSVSRKMQEDLYDWEKDDKAAKPYGKKPTAQKLDGVNDIGDEKSNARLIVKGGKTLTGEPRDTVELDPMMNNRAKMPDYMSLDKKKQKPQEQ
jgi:hypothetical protein